MTRGEIWFVDLGIPFGSEAGFRRPAIIIQNDELNVTSSYMKKIEECIKWTFALS